MNKKEAFDLLCETLTDYSFHPLFLKELGELLNKDLKGKEKVFFKCLTVQLNYINTFGTMVHTTDGHEQIHGFNGCYYSIHVEQSQFNVRLLVHIDGVSSPVFLCAFYERSGHRATSYERYTSVLETAIMKCRRVIVMGEIKKCGIDDLFSLFEDALSPGDILSAKLQAQVSTAITKERKKLGMTQAQFAEHIKVTQSQISRWECGNYNFTIDKIADIASMLDLNVDITFVPMAACRSLNDDGQIVGSSSQHPTVRFYSDSSTIIQSPVYSNETFDRHLSNVKEVKQYVAVC